MEERAEVGTLLFDLYDTVSELEVPGSLYASKIVGNTGEAEQIHAKVKATLPRGAEIQLRNRSGVPIRLESVPAPTGSPTDSVSAAFRIEQIR